MNGRSVGHAQPGVPVEAGRDRVVAVGPGVAVAPVLAAPAMDLLDLADRAGLDRRGDRAVDRRGVELDAHLGDELLLARHPGHLPGLVDRLRERLLGVDVQPALQRAHGDRGVHVVRGRDVDRVEVLLLVEQLAPVLVDLHVGEALLDLRGIPQVDVGHGDELDVRAGGDRADVGAGHARGAEAGVIDGLARRGAGVARKTIGAAKPAAARRLRADRRVNREAGDDIGRGLSRAGSMRAVRPVISRAGPGRGPSARDPPIILHGDSTKKSSSILSPTRPALQLSDYDDGHGRITETPVRTR